MNRETSQPEDLEKLVQTELNMETVASLVLSFLGFWVLVASTGKSAPTWLHILGWFFLLVGSANVALPTSPPTQSRPTTQKAAESLRPT
jgi:hypothetical protein